MHPLFFNWNAETETLCLSWILFKLLIYNVLQYHDVISYYDVYARKSPWMPEFPSLNGIKRLHTPLIPILSLSFGTHICSCKVMYPDKNWKHLCGILTNLVADSCFKGKKSEPGNMLDNLEDSFNETFLETRPHKWFLSSSTAPHSSKNGVIAFLKHSSIPPRT